MGQEAHLCRRQQGAEVLRRSGAGLRGGAEKEQKECEEQIMRTKGEEKGEC